MINIYNTLTRNKEELKPMKPGKVSMYVCGPTVYDVPHIGHARSSYVFDMIRRYFEYTGLEVFFVRNVTDVDDKIINKAQRELGEIGGNAHSASLKERVKEVAVRYLDVYHRELDILGFRAPTVEPKATENISNMIKFIEKLIEKGFAYAEGGSVYFSVEEFKEYGKLSNRDKDELLHGVRKEVDTRKRHPLDFALWKEAKPEEPSWTSPWGEGRPGWHIECSVMSTELLGDQFDIHGGGLDLIFPHHENEIAQSEAATGKPFANYWIHNGLLTVEGEKMSKSLGNYVTISDFLEKYKDPDLLKLSFLNSHYRSPMDYSDKKIQEAFQSKERIIIFLDKVERALREFSSDSKEDQDPIGIDAMQKAQGVVNELQEKFSEAMNDDLNTPIAMSVIFEAVKIGNDYLVKDDIPMPEKIRMVGSIKNFILRFSGILGLSLVPVAASEDETEKIEKLVTSREEARKNKDYSASDSIRGELAEMGVVVEDTPEGPIWRKK